MQINKKPSAISNELFDLSKTISNASTSAQLHGRYMMLKEMQIFLGQEEIKLSEQLKKAENDRHI